MSTNQLNVTTSSNQSTPLTESFNLSWEVKKRVRAYQEKSHPVDEHRKGSDELLEHLKGLLKEKLTTYAEHGRLEARLLEFKHGDGLKFDGIYAKDLLTKGDVIQRLQQYLDTDHADEDGTPAFFVYFSHIGKFQEIHNENKYGVFVNWDKKTWPNIKSRLAHTHIRTGHPHIRGGNYVTHRPPSGRDTIPSVSSHVGDTVPQSEVVPQGEVVPLSDGVSPTSGRGYGQGRGYGRGQGRGRGRGRGYGSVVGSMPNQSSSPPKDELPLSHDE